MAPFKMCRLPSRLGSRLHRFDYLSRKPGKISGKNDRFCPSLFLFCECEVGLGGVGRGWGGEEREFVAMSPEAGMSAIVKNKKKKESISISSIVLSTLGHARVMRELATLDRADSILSARNRPGIGQESARNRPGICWLFPFESVSDSAVSFRPTCPSTLKFPT